MIGYDEDPGNALIYGPGNPYTAAAGIPKQNVIPTPLAPGDRSGSHNIVIGRWNRFQGFGGFVGGEENSIGGEGSSILGGAGNTIQPILFAFHSYEGAIVGGYGNVISSESYECVVVGGEDNIAFSDGNVILGGLFNTSAGSDNTIIGGIHIVEETLDSDDQFDAFNYQPSVPFTP